MSNQIRRISFVLFPITLLASFCLAFFVNISAANSNDAGFASAHDNAYLHLFSGSPVSGNVHFSQGDSVIHPLHHLISLDEEEEYESEMDHVNLLPFSPVFLLPSSVALIPGHDLREKKVAATHFVHSLKDATVCPIYLLIEVFRI